MGSLVMANVAAVIRVEIMIVDHKATIYTEIQKPMDSMFEVIQENHDTMDIEEEFCESNENDPTVVKSNGDNPEVNNQLPGEQTNQTKIADGFHDSARLEPRTSTQILGHENVSLFNPGHSTISQQKNGSQQTGSQQTGSQQTGNQQTGSQQTGNQQTGSQVEPGQVGPGQVEPGQAGPSHLVRPTVSQKVFFSNAEDKYDFIVEKKEKWRCLKKFPFASFQTKLEDEEVIIDENSYPGDVEMLEYISRSELDIDGDSKQLQRTKNKNERQRAAKEKQPTKKKHARTTKRDDVFAIDESMEYCLTDIPETRQALIYQEKFLIGPLEYLVEHHKSQGNAQSESEEYVKKHIWPELKETYRYGEIMQRGKGDDDSGDTINKASWKSSCK